MTYLPKLPRIRLNDLRFKIPSLQIFALLNFILLLVATVFFSVKLVKAQIPAPAPIPCNDEEFPEFHTLRPYQASPCSDARDPVALFCGNDLVLTDTITRRRNDALYCQRFSPTEEECFFRVTQNRQLAIDVSGAELPIMGRTEDDVINSQNLSESRNDAQKVNEYVSWYLNGVYPPAEYGALDSDSEEDLSKLVDYSGPIKKLIPERIKRDQIRETIAAAGNTRHDQVVGCVYNLLAGLGQVGRIAECYPRSLTKDEIRLSGWDSRLPPVEEDPSFSSYDEFLRAYLIWRGRSCIRVPIINEWLCFEDPLRPNYWGDLYYQIPLSSTEDRYGEIEVVNPYVQPVQPDVTISNLSIITTPADLFFSHMEESQQLADTLQNTYVPKDNPKSGPVTGISPSGYCDLTEIRTNPGDDLFAGEIGVNLTYTAEFSCAFEIFDPPDPEDTWLCDIFSGYTGSCYSDDYDCDTWYGDLNCPNNWECGSGCSPDPPNPSCTRNTQVVLNTVTKTPLVDDIWSRLVAGVSGVFKRIFPKVEPGAPVEGILDIPAATGVTYRLDPPIAGVSLTAGNPRSRRGQAAELYFPHIGGIEQYFLQCIQTALRPQGFGEICYSGRPPNLNASDVCTGPCNPDPASVCASMTPEIHDKFLDLANRWLGDGVGSPRTNKYDQVVSASCGQGVDPLFTLAIWLHESGASNYDGICQVYGGSNPVSLYCQRIQDFGVNSSLLETQVTNLGTTILADNFDAQLNAFVNLPGYYLTTCDTNSVACPMQIFGSKYQQGTCSPNQDSDGYIVGIKEIYGWLSPTQLFPCYPIATP